MRWRLIVLSAAAAAILSPVTAQAQSCSSLRAERDAANRRGQALTRDNPGTALVAFGCMAVANSEYNRTGYARDAAGTFVGCGALGCSLTGDLQNCLAVGTEIIFQAIRVTAAQDEMRRRGCAW